MEQDVPFRERARRESRDGAKPQKAYPEEAIFWAKVAKNRKYNIVDVQTRKPIVIATVYADSVYYSKQDRLQYRHQSM
jgi:hypothetical protein